MDWVSFAAGCGFTVCFTSFVYIGLSVLACRTLCDHAIDHSRRSTKPNDGLSYSEGIPPRSYGRFDDSEFN